MEKKKYKRITFKFLFQIKIIRILLIILIILLIALSVAYQAHQYYRKRSKIQPLIVKNNRGLTSEEYKRLLEDLAAIIKKQDPQVALTTLKENMDKDNAIRVSCHEILHEIGRLSYEKYRSFTKAVIYRDDLCVSGYIHGVIEAYFSESEISDEFTTLCNTHSLGSYARWACVHGIGHGLMYDSWNNLPKSLKNCDRFLQEEDKSPCYDGVFMENYNADFRFHQSKYVSLDDPFMPCRMTSSHRESCYRNAPIYYLNYRNNDYDGALLWCDSVPWKFKSSCYFGVGVQTARRSGNNSRWIEKFCMSHGEEKTSFCIAGMTSWYIDYYTTIEPVKKICNSLEEPNKKNCLETIQYNKKLFSDK